MSFAARPVLVTDGVPSPLNINDATRITVSPTTAIAIVQFLNDGTGTSTTVGGGTSSWSWYSPTTTSIGSSYWVRATLMSGVTPTFGTMNSWVALSTNPLWRNTQGTTGQRLSEIKFEISANSAGTAIVGTDASVTITAEYEI